MVVKKKGFMKKIIIFCILAGLMSLGLSTSVHGISWFEKENEVKDEYLIRLFTPDLPYITFWYSKLNNLINFLFPGGGMEKDL